MPVVFQAIGSWRTRLARARSRLSARGQVDNSELTGIRHIDQRALPIGIDAECFRMSRQPKPAGNDLYELFRQQRQRLAITWRSRLCVRPRWVLIEFLEGHPLLRLQRRPHAFVC